MKYKKQCKYSESYDLVQLDNKEHNNKSSSNSSGSNSSNETDEKHSNSRSRSSSDSKDEVVYVGKLTCVFETENKEDDDDGGGEKATLQFDVKMTLRTAEIRVQNDRFVS
jgi:hypothetical protein